MRPASVKFVVNRTERRLQSVVENFTSGILMTECIVIEDMVEEFSIALLEPSQHVLRAKDYQQRL